MTTPIFIGDPVTAAGYRLAGAVVRTPGSKSAGASLRAALADRPSFIVMTAEYASRVPAELLEEALAAFAPPLLIVPDARGAVKVPDWGRDIRERILAE